MTDSQTVENAAVIPKFGRPLSEIVAALGPEVISASVIPEGVDPIVRGLDIHDAQSMYASGEGDLLGLISAQSLKPEDLDRAIVDGAANGCAGIVFTASEGGEAAILQRASYVGMPALVLTGAVTWREFDALLTRLLGEDAPSLQLAPSTGDKLFALANTIARVFGGSVAIEDHQRSILAHSSVPGQAMDELRTVGILYRRAGDAPVNERRYREVLHAEGLVRFPRYEQYLPRVAIAVRAGAIPLGTIWVLDPEGDETDRPLPTEQREVLEQSAVIAAGYLLDAWRGGNVSALPREEAYQRLLSGAGRLGDAELIDPAGDLAGVLVVLSVPARSQTAVRMAEIRAVLGRHLGVYVTDLLITVIGREIVALCPADSVEFVRTWVVAALRDLAEVNRAGILVGLSDPHPLRSGLPYALAEAREVMQNAASVPGGVATLVCVRPQLFLAACAAVIDADERLVLPEVQALLDDGERGAHLADTFDCWMQETGNIARTARRLRVHEQTVRYRLRRLTEMLGIDARSSDRLLAVWLQLHLLRGGPTQASPSAVPRSGAETASVEE